MNINLPDNLTTTKSLEFAESLNRLAVTEAVTLYPKLKWARPFGMLYTTAVVRQFRHRYADIHFSMDRDTGSAGSYAGYMGFFKSISEVIPIGNMPGEVTGNDRYVPITKLSMKELRSNSIAEKRFEEDGDIIERYSNGLARVLSFGNSDVEYLFTHAIREMIRNTPEHSGSDTIWVCGQSYPKDRTAEIAVLDEGIGITNSLRRNRFYNSVITDDEEALQYSILPGVSQAFAPGHEPRDDDNWHNSGYGLYVLSELCDRLNGSFCIVTGNRYLLKASHTIKTGPTYFNGTAVKMMVGTQGFSGFDRIIRDIIKDGEQIARKNKNAIKHASRPSRGLMLK